MHQEPNLIQPLEVQQDYEKLDKLLGESMRYSEHHASKVFSTKYDWSPVLDRAVNNLCLWTLCLKWLKELGYLTIGFLLH
jgi:hypothetical protein